MHLMVGLGNPGPEHAGERHNIGFMAADAIARRHRLPAFREKFKGLVTDGTIDGERVLVLKPRTFMNLSGESVAAAMQFYKLGPADLTVMHDEIDLAPGKLKVKTGGGTGGHNGIRSIEAHLGSDFRRVRLGVGHPGHKDLVSGHVLNNFAKSDRQWLEPLLDAIAANAAFLAKGDEANFMNRVALATRPAAPAAESPKAPAPAEKSASRGPMAKMLARLFGGKG